MPAQKKKKFGSYFMTPGRTGAEIRPSLHSYIFIFMDAWVIFKPLSLPPPLHFAHNVCLCPLRVLLLPEQTLASFNRLFLSTLDILSFPAHIFHWYIPGLEWVQKCKSYFQNGGCINFQLSFTETMQISVKLSY